MHVDHIANGKRCCLRTGDRNVARPSGRKDQRQTWFYSKPRMLGYAADPQCLCNDGGAATGNAGTLAHVVLLAYLRLLC